MTEIVLCNLEIVWGLLRPKEVSGKITKIIVCCFYCPPKSTKKSALIEQMTLTLQHLRTTFPMAAAVISGDRNDLSIVRLLTVDPALRQTVRKNTRGQKILTVVLTDLEVFYEEPVIVDPIDVDDPTKGGVPSDHNGVVVTTRTETDKPVVRQKIARTIRPITSSNIVNMGQVFTAEQWVFMDPELTSTQLTELFQYYTAEVLNTFCPQKTVYSRPDADPFVTENMKVLKRNILRVYEKKGKTAKYFEMKSSFEEKLKTGMTDTIEYRLLSVYSSTFTITITFSKYSDSNR